MLLFAALLIANTTVSPVQEVELLDEETQVVVLDEEEVLESQEIIFDEEIASLDYEEVEVLEN